MGIRILTFRFILGHNCIIPAFLVSIIRVFRFRSLKKHKDLLTPQANLVKNCTNLCYLLQWFELRNNWAHFWKQRDRTTIYVKIKKKNSFSYPTYSSKSFISKFWSKACIFVPSLTDFWLHCHPSNACKIWADKS